MMRRPILRCNFEHERFILEWEGRQPEEFQLFYAALGRAVELSTQPTEVEVHDERGLRFTIPVGLERTEGESSERAVRTPAEGAR